MYVEVFPFDLDSGKFPVPDGEKGNFETNTCLGFGGTHLPSLDSETEFKKRTGKVSEALESFKRPSSDFYAEVANKRAKPEHKAINIASEEKLSSEESAFVLDGNDKIADATEKDFIGRTALGQVEAFRSPLSEHSHWRSIPIGSDHQADLPKWTPLSFKSNHPQSRFYDTDSSAVNSSALSPSMDTGVGVPVIDCCCGDEGSIMCVRQHVKEAREKLRRDVGQNKFVELGFPDMGEDVAERWTKTEDNLFRAVVSSNSPSLGRNFWTVLPRVFQSRSFRELVSYYFNVFMLRKRADQNRFDPLNVDSDDDDWQVNCHGDEEDDDEQEDDSAVESPADANSLEDDVSEELDDQDEVDDEEFYCSKPLQMAERNSKECSLDQDVQDGSCTSFDRLYNSESGRENLDKEHGSFEYIDGDCDSKLWEINYIGGAEKEFEFFPTCNVLEQVFGKASSSWDKDDRDDTDLS